MRLVALVLALIATAGCGGATSSEPHAGRLGSIEADGIRLGVPARWHGRRFPGCAGVVQAASFALRAQPGREDPIKAMHGSQVLVTVDGEPIDRGMRLRPANR